MIKSATSAFVHHDYIPTASTFILEQDIRRAIQRGDTKMCCSVQVTKTTTWASDFVDVVNSLKKKYGHQIAIESAFEVGFWDASGRLDLPKLDLKPDILIVRPTLVPYGNAVYTPRQIRLLWMDELTTPHMVFRHLFRAMIGAMWTYPNVVVAEPLHLVGQVGLHEMDIPVEMLAGFAQAVAETQTPLILQQAWIRGVNSAVEVLKLFGLNQSGKAFGAAIEQVPQQRYNLSDLSPLEVNRAVVPRAHAA
ncbi:MAG: hypothetical protein JNN12_12580 [Bacteroidetes Order II. Incertae sedis bacterium]|nr:hypothetical protein [Bacteroidetes Order II. bacterium]